MSVVLADVARHHLAHAKTNRLKDPGRVSAIASAPRRRRGMLVIPATRSLASTPSVDFGAPFALLLVLVDLLPQRARLRLGKTSALTTHCTSTTLYITPMAHCRASRLWQAPFAAFLADGGTKRGRNQSLPNPEGAAGKMAARLGSAFVKAKARRWASAPLAFDPGINVADRPKHGRAEKRRP